MIQSTFYTTASLRTQIVKTANPLKMAYTCTVLAWLGEVAPRGLRNSRIPIRELYKVRKKKKVWNFPDLGLTPPPPWLVWKIQAIFFKLLASFWATLGKNVFFPLKKSKYLENFHQFCSVEGDTPPENGKIFFAFLDELDHSTHF